MKGRNLFLCGLLVVIAFFLSLQGFPLPWQDEIHILEMGRSTLDGLDHPSAFAIGDSGRNFIPFYFIGPCLQEAAYRALGFCGPRLSSLLGLLAAAFFCGLWMRRCGASRACAAVSSLMLLLSALPMQSVRLVRVDSWAFAILFLSLYAVVSCRRSPALGFFVCGFLFGLNAFVWPSAILFGPFVLWALVGVWHKEETSRTRIVRDIVTCALGGALAVLVCLFLSPNGIASTLAQYYRVNEAAARPPFSLVSVLAGCGVAWTKEVLRDPVFFIWVSCGVLVAFKGRLHSLLVLAALTFVLMLPSGLHTYRLLYLWPFLVVLATKAYEALEKCETRKAPSLVFASAAFLFAANVLAYALAAQVNPRPDDETVRERLADVVGTGPSNVVYSLSFQPYFVARSLGWTYLRYADNTHVYDAKTRRDLFARVNVVLLPHEPLYYAVEESWTPFGLLRNAMIDAARRDAETGSHSRLGKIGASLAFRCDSRAQTEAFSRDLTEMGFAKVGSVSFADWRAKIPMWFRPYVGLLLAAEGYDDLDVWKRRPSSR